MSCIIWLTDDYLPDQGGMALSCERIVTQLRQCDICIHVVHFTNDHPPFEIEQQHNGTYMACPVDKDEAHSLNVAWKVLENRMRHEKFSHLVAFGGLRPMLAGPVFADWMDIPLITMIRGLEFEMYVFSSDKRKVLDHAFHRSRTVCAVSKEKAYKIAKLYKDVTVAYTPSGIDLKGWDLTDENRIRAKAIRAQSDKRTIGIFGKFKARKGVSFFIKAICESHVHDQVRLLIAGDLTEKSEKKLEKYGVEYELFPYMEREKLLDIYPACDAVAIPSFYDGMPNVLLEAGALGVPIIGSRVDGMKDLIDDGENGFLFAPGSLDGCTHTLEAFLNTPTENLQEMGDRLKKLIRASYTIEKECECFLNIFG
ncbi:glycosyltransferase family 4 protein [Limibacter armeniacum]|uniref:glycosyltransferase family 4 protein n=1 Tax=Limibacter armeniacum TaxID=466084 RepID=UPI002FE66CE5